MLMTSRLIIFLGILSAGSLAAANPSSEGAVTTNLPHYNNHLPELMLDGKPETFFWTSRPVKGGETIQMTFKNALPARQILHIRDGNLDGKDHFIGAVIEGSLDGKSWEEIGKRRTGLLIATIPRAMKYIRLRATRNTGGWVAIREVQLLKTSPLHTHRSTIAVNGKKIPITLTANLEHFADLQPRFEKMAKIYSDVWPKLVEMLGSPIDATHRDVEIMFEAKMDHPAHASGNKITISAEHLRRDPADTEGVFIHELTHVIQRYRGPGWLVEGVADYTRYKLKNDDAWGKRCRQHIAYDKPFGAYWRSTAFLLYLEDTYKKPIVRDVSVAMRAGRFNEAMWKTLTGKTLQELAADYKISGWKPAP